MSDDASDLWWKEFQQHYDDFKVCFVRAGVGYLTDDLVAAVEEGNLEETHALLDQCWFAAPDVPEIHSWPSWGVMCDLLSDPPIK